MTDPRVNKYRSAKNPHRQVLVAELPEGSYLVGILDSSRLTLVQTIIGKELEQEDSALRSTGLNDR